MKAATGLSVFSTLMIVVVLVVLLPPPAAADARPEVDPWAKADGPTTSTGEGVVVGLIDGPILADHPAWEAGAGRVYNAPDQPGHIPTSPAEVDVLQNHGTLTASVIHAAAPGADVVVYTPGLSRWESIWQNGADELAGAVNRAVDGGVDVLVMPWSVSGNGFDRLRESILRAEAAGILVVVAAGNNGADAIGCGGGTFDGLIAGIPEGEPQFPTEMPEVFTVGGVQQDGSPWACSVDGAHVDAVAPATEVRAADITGGFTEVSGTSFAAPHWGGVAALILERFPGLPPGVLRDYMLRVSTSNEGRSMDHADRLVPGQADLDRIRMLEDWLEAGAAYLAFAGAVEGRPVGQAAVGTGDLCGFVVEHNNGFIDLELEINAFQSNPWNIVVRGLIVQVAGEWETTGRSPDVVGGPDLEDLETPDFATITDERGEEVVVEIRPSRNRAGCGVAQGTDNPPADDWFTEWADEGRTEFERLIFDNNGAGLCALSGGTYRLSIDYGYYGRHNAEFEISQQAIDDICCEPGESRSATATSPEATVELELGQDSTPATPRSGRGWSGPLAAGLVIAVAAGVGGALVIRRG